MRCAWALLAAAGLAACTVGPDYRRPEVATPPAYAEAASTPRTAVTPADADLSAWWAQFGDPELSSLIARALAGNLDRQTAISRVRQARLSEIVARAAEYPSLSAAGNALTFNSNRKSGGAPAQGTGPPTAGAGGLPIPSHLNLYSAGFDATWEVDLFGATRRAIEEARANTGAALWARRDGEVTLTAEVASDYLGLRMLQARIAIGEAELARQKGVFALIRARRQAGFVTSLDVNQQTTVVETAAAQLPQLEAQAKVQVHALAILMGEPPEGLAAELGANAAALPAPPPTLPVGLPSELLRRRPDIREAERRLAAANAGIGVQVASLYPKLDLIGLAAFAGTSLGDLFSIRNLSSAALAMASQPVFDAGRRRASVGIAREETVQASLAYQAAVLGALRDVEDALARYRSEETRREALERYLVAASNSLTIAQDQYRTGFVTFINVLQAQNAVLGARDQLAQSDAQVLADLVAIYKALGGGWST